MDDGAPSYKTTATEMQMGRCCQQGQTGGLQGLVLSEGLQVQLTKPHQTDSRLKRHLLRHSMTSNETFPVLRSASYWKFSGRRGYFDKPKPYSTYYCKSPGNMKYTKCARAQSLEPLLQGAQKLDSQCEG